MTTGYVTGTFDPVTEGHIFLLRETVRLFGNAVALVLINPDKACEFSLENRMEFLRLATEDMPEVSVAFYHGFAVDYVNLNGGGIIVRGVRGEADFEYEAEMARVNKEIGGVETFILHSPDALVHLSSTTVREGISRGNYDGLPEKVADAIQKGA
ncbi:MAG: pantetheine-phosphate adenylyltransferase [Clostridiaceae bacterium]|jgi:pantetheine-phosphate adenylyltransferase|nr:pantetheine-phosphate adenylyltransferase [Clostridiaceae bacterium]